MRRGPALFAAHSSRWRTHHPKSFSVVLVLRSQSPTGGRRRILLGAVSSRHPRSSHVHRLVVRACRTRRTNRRDPTPAPSRSGPRTIAHPLRHLRHRLAVPGHRRSRPDRDPCQSPATHVERCEQAEALTRHSRASVQAAGTLCFRVATMRRPPRARKQAYDARFAVTRKLLRGARGKDPNSAPFVTNPAPAPFLLIRHRNAYAHFGWSSSAHARLTSRGAPEP